jgi:hypothetical protein
MLLKTSYITVAEEKFLLKRGGLGQKKPGTQGVRCYNTPPSSPGTYAHARSQKGLIFGDPTKSPIVGGDARTNPLFHKTTHSTYYGDDEPWIAAVPEYTNRKQWKQDRDALMNVFGHFPDRDRERYDDSSGTDSDGSVIHGETDTWRDERPDAWGTTDFDRQMIEENGKSNWDGKGTSSSKHLVAV